MTPGLPQIKIADLCEWASPGQQPNLRRASEAIGPRYSTLYPMRSDLTTVHTIPYIHLHKNPCRCTRILMKRAPKGGCSRPSIRFKAQAVLYRAASKRKCAAAQSKAQVMLTSSLSFCRGTTFKASSRSYLVLAATL